MKVSLPEQGTWYEYIPEISDEIKISDEEFESLWNEHPEEQGKVIIYGRELTCPRWFQSYGRPYKFAGINHEAKPIDHPILKKILQWVNNHSGTEYNEILVNWYESGENYIGWHSDDESELTDSPIYSFSFGATRTFWIRSKEQGCDNKYLVDQKFELPNNSLFIMGNGFQSTMKHHVPKRLKVKERRINLTFRKFK